MNWILIALLAPATYAIVTFIDKYLLSGVVKDYKAMPIYTAIVGFLAGTIFWLYNGFPLLTVRDSLIVLSTGILTGFSLITYFKALSEEETSNVTVLFQMFPIITLIFAYIFLHEILTTKQFLGFFLMLSAALLTSVKRDNSKFNFSKAFLLILIYDILWASSGILMKYAINANSFSRVITYESWGIGVGGIFIYILFADIRKAFNKSIKNVKIKTLAIIGLNETVFVIAKSLTFLAFSLGPAAIVSVLETSQTFFAILYGWILTLLIPTIFKEDISTKGLGKKILAAIILLAGVVLVYQ
jgi:drug/metabolite transporter (DMT)-like permease